MEEIENSCTKKENVDFWFDDPRLSHLPFHMRGDEWIKIRNIEAGYKLCERCGGTGNELNSMYKKCTACSGTGIEGGKSIPYEFSENDGIPKGWVKIEAYSNGKEIVVLGEVDENDEEHNCDEMGCRWDHVIHRFKIEK